MYLVWCEKHTCRSRVSKGKQTSQSCLSSNFIFKAVKRCSLVLRTRSVKEYVFPWAFLQDDSKTIWFPFENSRPGVDAVVPFNLGRYKTQHIYILYTFKMFKFLIFQCDRELESYIWETLAGAAWAELTQFSDKWFKKVLFTYNSSLNSFYMHLKI